MGEFWNMRRKATVFILFWMVVFSFAASASGYWIHWTAITAIVFAAFITDLVFLNDGDFVYDPSYASWEAKMLPQD